MTVLDEILEASTDSTVPVPDILRKVQIAATRLGATAIVDWARSELSGYGDDATLPSYRHTNANVMGLFTGPMQSQIRQQLTTRLTEMNHLWEVELRMPLVELQGLATAEGDPRREWTASDVRRYEESGVYRIYLHTLFTAWNILSKQNLLGIVDVVRTKAMEFALELQASFPEAGSVGGPTVASEPALAPIVYNITNNITGHGTNIAAGPGARQTSTVVAGDVAGLQQALSELGLSEADKDEFVAAIEEDQSTSGGRVSRFLSRVRSGGVRLAEGLTTDVAAESLVALARGFLGLGG